MTEKCFQFTAAVRGFHVYRSIWKPYMEEELTCDHEYGNAFDCFAIKTEKDGRIVGHLPREISRPTKFLIDRGAKVIARITSNHYRKSPLFQGGLEVKCLVTVILPATVRGHLLLSNYEEMVKQLYTEPKEETIMGSYLTKHFPVNNTNVALQENERKRKKNGKKDKNVKSKDIRDMLKRFK